MTDHPGTICVALLAAKMLNATIENLTDEQRLEVFMIVQDGYCRHCGGDNLPCWCWNDE